MAHCLTLVFSGVAITIREGKRGTSTTSPLRNNCHRDTAVKPLITVIQVHVCSVTEFVLEDVKYYYWLARFGGNAAGHVIRGCAPPSTTGDILNSRAIFSSLLGGPWVAVAQNVDDDLTWTCPTNPAPEGFMERLREVAERG